jgi:hypothetical protein
VQGEGADLPAVVEDRMSLSLSFRMRARHWTSSIVYFESFQYCITMFHSLRSIAITCKDVRLGHVRLFKHVHVIEGTATVFYGAETLVIMAKSVTTYRCTLNGDEDLIVAER